MNEGKYHPNNPKQNPNKVEIGKILKDQPDMSLSEATKIYGSTNPSHVLYKETLGIYDIDDLKKRKSVPWDDMSYQQQVKYLQEHPGSKRRITATPTQGEPEQVDVAGMKGHQLIAQLAAMRRYKKQLMQQDKNTDAIDKKMEEIKEVMKQKNDDNVISFSDEELKVLDSGKPNKKVIEALLGDEKKLQQTTREQKHRLGTAAYNIGIESHMEQTQKLFNMPVKFDEGTTLKHGTTLSMKDMGKIFGEGGSVGINNELYMTTDLSVSFKFSRKANEMVNIVFVADSSNITNDVYLDPDPYSDSRRGKYPSEQFDSQYKTSSISPDSIKDVIVGNHHLENDSDFLNTLGNDDIVTKQPSFTVFTRKGFIKYLEYNNIV